MTKLRWKNTALGKAKHTERKHKQTQKHRNTQTQNNNHNKINNTLSYSFCCSLEFFLFGSNWRIGNGVVSRVAKKV
jgi:hypothetical protein